MQCSAAHRNHIGPGDVIHINSDSAHVSLPEQHPLLIAHDHQILYPPRIAIQEYSCWVPPHACVLED